MTSNTNKRGSRKMVTTGAITSRKLARITPVAECVYWRVYFAADKYGTMSGDAWDVLQTALPGKSGVTEDIVKDALVELVSIGLIETWCEADRSTWIHVIGHDGHQQPSWLSKRGHRLTPVPPSLRSVGGEYVSETDPLAEQSPAIASEGSQPGPNAEVEPSLANAAFNNLQRTTPTSTGKEGPREDALPSALQLVCIDAAEKTRLSAEWWIDTISIHRRLNASAPESVFIEAIADLLGKLDGKPLKLTSAVSTIRGFVNISVIRWKEGRSTSAPADDHSAMYAALNGDGPKPDHSAIFANLKSPGTAA